MTRQHIGVYPGTFDPIHNGHVDVIRRATLLVDKLIVAVAINAGKDPLFALEERVRMVEGDINSLMAANAINGAKVEVRPFRNLLIQFAADNGADFIVRGLRAVSDFEYEFQMAGMNRSVYPEVETVFLTPGEQHMFISASMVREIARLGGDVSKFVQPCVDKRLRATASVN